jgi:hypothetical protein
MVTMNRMDGNGQGDGRLKLFELKWNGKKKNFTVKSRFPVKAVYEF